MRIIHKIFLHNSHKLVSFVSLNTENRTIMADEPSFEILQNEVVYTKPDGTVIRTEAVGNHFTIKETPEGREMICSIDAKAGDLIFCEQAYAITPETSLLTSKKLCLMCCKALRIKDATSSVNDLAPVAVHCPSCNLAFCSTECAKNIIHELECGLIPKVCEAVIEADSKGHKLELSPMLLIIRILLKGLLDKGFTLIEGMLSHVQEHSPSWRKKYEIFAEAFCRDLPANEDGSKLFSEARIVEMACLLDTNAFGGVNQVTSQQLSTGLFYYSALLNNSCDPNVIYSVLDDKITMRAIKEIPKGTPLRDTYVDLLFPTRERQATLLKSKAFFCTCERCKDPSEQGRYLSAWKCGKEGCDGYMLPTVSFAKETKQITQTWACEKCGTTNKDDEGVPGQIQKLREFLAQRTWNADPASFVRIAEQQCSPLLPSLHSNHHLRVFYALEMANALRAQKKYDEAVVFMGQVCGIVTKIAPNTTQETDCLCQLGQLYAHLFIEASEAEKANPSTTTQKAKTEFAQLYRKATADSLRVARICLGEYHPHTIALSKTFAT